MNFESTLTIANKVSFHYDHRHCHHHHHHHHHYYQRHHYDGLQPQYAIINNDTNLKTIEVSITHINPRVSQNCVLPEEITHNATVDVNFKIYDSVRRQMPDNEVGKTTKFPVPTANS
uniref:Uncharacterized protein n=1 Tax=Glossina pallidipes TaxID=7398 RepID=A0A1B0GGM5_GLOPL